MLALWLSTGERIEEVWIVIATLIGQDDAKRIREIVTAVVLRDPAALAERLDGPIPEGDSFWSRIDELGIDRIAPTEPVMNNVFTYEDICGDEDGVYTVDIPLSIREDICQASLLIKVDTNEPRKKLSLAGLDETHRFTIDFEDRRRIREIAEAVSTRDRDRLPTLFDEPPLRETYAEFWDDAVLGICAYGDLVRPPAHFWQYVITWGAIERRWWEPEMDLWISPTERHDLRLYLRVDTKTVPHRIGLKGAWIP